MSPKAFPLARLFFGKTDEKAQSIRQNLMLALETRADFNMDFFLHDRLLYQLKGACVEVRADAVKVYLRGGNHQLPPPGMRVHVYFVLRLERKSVPFDFLSEVRFTEREGGDAFLWLPMPEDMGHNQRRYNVRVPVRKEEIEGFQVWYGKPAAEVQVEVVGPDAPAAQKIQWVPVPLEHTELLDLSAGGAQIGLAPTAPVYPLISPREMLLTRGTFELKDKPPQHLAMVGTVVRVHRSDDLPWAQLGVSFRRWGAMMGDRFVWRNLGDQEGISPLGAWVFQLILNRRKMERDDKDGPGAPRSGLEKDQSQHNDKK